MAPFPCIATPWPTTAPDPLNVYSTVYDPVGGPIGGAAVEIRDADDDHLVASATTPNNGFYLSEIATGGVAPHLYRRVTATGRVESLFFDPFALYDDDAAITHLSAITVSPSPQYRDELYASAGLTYDPSQATILALVVDCELHELRGARVEVPGAARVLYLDSNGKPGPDADGTVNGIALVLGVPAGPVDATVSVDSTVFRPWQIKVAANTYAQVTWAP